MALVTPFIQNLLNYPVLSSGFLLGTRGIGTFVGMFLVGRLSGKVDPRILILIGLVLATASLWLMVGWILDVSAETIVINSVAQGFGLGFIFVPLNTIAFASLPGELRTEGAALWTLIRNIGSSVGISVVIARLTSMTTMFHSQLVEHATPFNDALQNAERLDGLGARPSEHGDARRDDHPASGDYGLFQQLPVHDLRRALRLPAAGAHPVDQVRGAGFARRSCGARGDGLSQPDLATLSAPRRLRRSRDLEHQIREPLGGVRDADRFRRRRRRLSFAGAASASRRIAASRSGVNSVCGTTVAPPAFASAAAFAA